MLRDLLKGAIYKNGNTLTDVAQALGIMRCTFSRKMTTESFTIQDVRIIKSFLSLTPDEVDSIFFN